MFPAPSPSSQAIFNSMSGGLATPGTLDFHRTALNAAARSKVDNNTQPAATAPQLKHEYPAPPAAQSQMAQDSFANHADRDVANSLYMLSHGNRSANQFAVPPPPQQMNMGGSRMGPPSQDTSPTTQRGGRISNAGTEGSIESPNEDEKTSKGRGGRKTSGSGKGAVNGRRKADDTPMKGPANKRAKGNAGMPQMDDDDDMMDDDDIKMENDIGPNGKKMTDEEKRKNFLERNRCVLITLRVICYMLMRLIVSPRSNVDSERSSGWPICKPRSKSSHLKMMRSMHRTLS